MLEAMTDRTCASCGAKLPAPKQTGRPQVFCNATCRNNRMKVWDESQGRYRLMTPDEMRACHATTASELDDINARLRAGA